MFLTLCPFLSNGPASKGVDQKRFRFDIPIPEIQTTGSTQYLRRSLSHVRFLEVLTGPLQLYKVDMNPTMR